MKNQKTHVLCLRFSSLGDVLLQSSFLSMLKKEFGDSIYLTFMTAEEFAPVFEGHPHIDHILSFSRKEGVLELFKVFSHYHRGRPVDFIFDLHNTLRANLLKWRFFFIPRLTVDKRTLSRKLITSPFHLKGLLRGENIMERTIRDWNFLWKKDYKREELSEFVHPENNEQQGISSLPLGEGLSLKKWGLEKGSYLVLIPSASYSTKRWPIDSFFSLAKRLLEFMPVLVLGGPKDDFCQVFDSIKQKKHPLLNLQGKTSFKEASEIVGGAKLCIGNDTGLIHMAEAQGSPVFMLMGPTGEEFGFTPHLKNSHVFSRTLSCRPCSPTGKKKCGRKSLLCLEKITVEDVYGKALEFLKC